MNLLHIAIQDELRAECYNGLVDAMNSHLDQPIGRRIILPATTIGSPRYMHQRFQDSMALVRKFGKPDLFITMTCNPNWAEIKSELLPHQKPDDRPDIVVRVFHIKLHKLIDEIKGKIFGETRAWCYVIEFQKRGLPHAHILVLLANKIQDADSVDGL